MKNKAMGNYLNMVALLVTAVAFVLYFLIYLPEAGQNDMILIVLFLISMVLGGILLFFRAKWSAWIEIVLAFVSALIPMRIITSDIVIMSVVDLTNSIDYFGNAELIPRAVVVCVLCLVAVLCTVVGAFCSRE